MIPLWDSPWLRRDVLLTYLTLVLTLDGAGGDQDVPNPGRMQCNVAQQKCVARVGCSMALHNYLVYCGSVMHGQTDMCPARCRKALVSLLSTEDREGEAFMECDCNGNTYCHTQKERLEVCSRDVLDAMKRLNDDSTEISCSLAELICRADTSCLAALQYFDMNCDKLQTGDKCTARCNNSINILLRQKKARKLRTCICDGTETYACDTVQESIERLCYHNRRSSKPRHPHHHNHTRGRHHGTNKGPHYNATHVVDGPLPDHDQQVVGCSNASSDIGSHCVSSSSASSSIYGIPQSRTRADLSALVASAVLVLLLAYRQR